MADTKESKVNIWEELRKPFRPEVIGKLPRGNVTLDFIGHAAVTDRLNNVLGPDNWNWEPFALDEFGLPQLDGKGNLWIKLMIRDHYRSSPDEPAWVIRLGYGDGSSSIKELIGDALRNAAMRFGVALDLWSKDELESTLENPELKNRPAPVKAARQPLSPQMTKTKISAELTKMGFDSEQRKQIVYGIADVDMDSTLTPGTLNHVLGVINAAEPDDLRILLEADDPKEPES